VVLTRPRSSIRPRPTGQDHNKVQQKIMGVFRTEAGVGVDGFEVPSLGLFIYVFVSDT